MGQINITVDGGIAGMIQSANTASNGMISLFLLALAFIVMMYRNRDEGIVSSTGAALFVTTLLSLILWLGNFIPVEWFATLTACLMLFVASVRLFL